MGKKQPAHRATATSNSLRAYDEVDDRITIPLGSSSTSTSTSTSSTNSSSHALRSGIDKYRSLSGRSSSSSTISSTAADKSVHATWKSGLVAAVRSSSASSSSFPSSSSVATLSPFPSSSSTVKESAVTRAEKLMNQKQYAAALPVFSEALQAAGSSAQTKLKLFFQRGSCALHAHKYKQAIEDFTHVIDFTPSNALLLAKRARAHAALHHHNEAIKDYSDAIVMMAPTQEELRGLFMARARVYGDMNNVSAALEDLRHAQLSTRGGDRDPDLFYQRAELRKKCRQFKMAVQDLDKFMELQEDWSGGGRHQDEEEDQEDGGQEEEEGEDQEERSCENGGAGGDEEQPEDAEEDARRRRLVDVRMERAAMLRLLAKDEEAKRLKDAELAAIEQGEQQPLLGGTEMATASVTRDYQTSVETKGKRRQRSAVTTTTIQSQQPQQRRVNRTTAMYAASYRSRDALALVERAIDDYSQILVQDAGHTDALRQRAECWALVDRADNAFRDFDAALAIDANDFQVQIAKAKLLFAQRDTQQAVQELTRVLEVNGYFVDALYLRAEMYEALGEWERARSDYTAIVDAQFDGKGNGSSSSHSNVSENDGSGSKQRTTTSSSSNSSSSSLLVLHKPISEYAIQALLLRARVSQEMNDFDSAARDYERILESSPNNIEAQYELQENRVKKEAFEKQREADAVAWLEQQMSQGDMPSGGIAVGGGGGAGVGGASGGGGAGGAGGAASGKAKKKKKKSKKKGSSASTSTPATTGDDKEKQDELETNKPPQDTLRIEDIHASDAVPAANGSGSGDSPVWRQTLESSAFHSHSHSHTREQASSSSTTSSALAKKSSFSSVSIVVTRDEACESMWDDQPDEDAVAPLPLPLPRLRLTSASGSASRGTSPLAGGEFFPLRIDEHDEHDASNTQQDRTPLSTTTTTTTTTTDDEDDEPDVEEPTPLEIAVSTVDQDRPRTSQKGDKDMEQEEDGEEENPTPAPSTPSHVTIRERLVDEKYLKKRQKQLEKLRAQLLEACEARLRDVIEETIARAERKQMLEPLEEQVAMAKRVVREIDAETKRVDEEQRKQERYRQQELERAKRLQKEENEKREQQAAKKAANGSITPESAEAGLPSPKTTSPNGSALVIRPIAYGHALHVAEQHQQQVLQFQRLISEKDAEIAYLKSLVASSSAAAATNFNSIQQQQQQEQPHHPSSKATIAKLLRGELDLTSLAPRVDALLEWMSPSAEADEARVGILRFVRRVLERHWPTTNLGLMPLVFVATGSFPMKTYLPTADLDVTLFLPKELEPSWHLTVLHALCLASDTSDDIGGSGGAGAGGAAVANGSPDAKGSSAIGSSSSSSSSSSLSSHTVRNVSFINAEVRVVKSTIDNVSVDLTANRVGALGALLVLDEMDRRVGQNHLLKRSLVLVKSWCACESSQFMPATTTSGGVLGASSGALSTYAINTIVMALFNQYGALITHPLSCLVLFLDKMAEFPWHESALTLFGEVPLGLLATSGSLAIARLKLQQQQQQQRHSPHYHQYNTSSYASKPSLDHTTLMAMEDVERIRVHVHDQFGALDPSFTPTVTTTTATTAASTVAAAAASPVGGGATTLGATAATTVPTNAPSVVAAGVAFKPSSSTFQIRACNVVDPVDDSNNLARSVSSDVFPSMKRAFAQGRDRLVALLSSSSSSVSSSSSFGGSGGGAGASVGTEMDAFFASCWKEYGRGDGWRPDLLVHPRQTWHARPATGSSKQPAALSHDKWQSLVPEFLMTAPQPQLQPTAMYVQQHNQHQAYMHQSYQFMHHQQQHQQQQHQQQHQHYPPRHHQHQHQHHQQHQYAPLQHQQHLVTNGGGLVPHYQNSPSHANSHSHSHGSPGHYNANGSSSHHRIPSSASASATAAAVGYKSSPRRAQSLPGTSSAVTLAAAVAAAAALRGSGSPGGAATGPRGAHGGANGGVPGGGPSQRSSRRSHDSPPTATPSSHR